MCLTRLLRLGLLLVCAAAPLAPRAQGFAIDWFSVDGGGLAGATKSTGGGYELEGTIGQADTVLMSGGPYQLQGGFWAIAYGPEKAMAEAAWELYE